MRRTFLAAIAIAAAASTAAAQSPDSTARQWRPDSSAHVLESVVVTAPAASDAGGLFARLGARANYTELLRANRSLERQLRGYDAQIVKLETRLARAKFVHDSLEYDIVAYNEWATAVREQRMRLEARLRRQEATLAGRADATAPAAAVAPNDSPTPRR